MHCWQETMCMCRERERERGEGVRQGGQGEESETRENAKGKYVSTVARDLRMRPRTYAGAHTTHIHTHCTRNIRVIDPISYYY